MILFFLHFLDAAGIDRGQVRYRVYIHENADSVAAGRFWRELTGAKSTQFYRPTFKRHGPKTVRKNVADSYHGCLCIRVRQSADLYRRIEGWARATMNSGGDDVTQSRGPG